MEKRSNLNILEEQKIKSRIFFVRGQKIMLDRDLAEMYGVETRVLKQAVKRNIDRFPIDFMFEMTQKEFKQWREENNLDHSDKMGLRYAPYCFTEQGLTMLSCVLNSPRAIEVNIRVVRIFTKLREQLLTNKDILLKLEQVEKQVGSNTQDIQKIFNALRQLLNPPIEKRNPIGYKINVPKEKSITKKTKI